MGYQSNAAYAYDMQPQADDRALELERPRVQERPRLDVVTGAGLKADQQLSPAFLAVAKFAFAIFLAFIAVGAARVVITNIAAANLRAATSLQSELETLTDECSDLEVMRSVYGSPSRIRDLASSMYGMVQGDGNVTVDLSQGAATE